LFVFGIILFSSFAYACGGGADQLIMKLSGPANAHGEIYTGTYSTEICYDELITDGNPYTEPSPHNGNTIGVYLSDSTNAHASITKDTTYNEEIRYGDLECSTVTGESSCETANICSGSDVTNHIILTLSADTNAHISKGIDENYESTARYICCCSPSAESSAPTIYAPNSISGIFSDAKLAFFTLRNMVITLLLLVVGYYIYLKKRKRKKK